MATSSIEKVTNNSGSNYCKMPDGTLIQWGASSFLTGNTGAAYPAFGDTMYAGWAQITFPIAFISTPSVSAGGDFALYGAVDIRADQTSKTTFRVEGAHNAANTRVYFHWIAIGRWK